MYACTVGLSKHKHMLNCYIISQTAALVSLLVSPFVGESASTLDMEDLPKGAGSSGTTELRLCISKGIHPHDPGQGVLGSHN